MPDTTSDIPADPGVPPPSTVDHVPSDAGPGPSSRGAGGGVTPRASDVDTVNRTTAHVLSVTSDHAATPGDDPGPRVKAERGRGIGHLPGYEILRQLGRGGM